MAREGIIIKRSKEDIDEGERRESFSKGFKLPFTKIEIAKRLKERREKAEERLGSNRDKKDNEIRFKGVWEIGKWKVMRRTINEGEGEDEGDQKKDGDEEKTEEPGEGQDKPEQRKQEEKKPEPEKPNKNQQPAPEDQDEYDSAPGSPSERIIFEINPPKLGYYASGRASYYDIDTKTWSKKKQLSPYNTPLQGRGRTTISGVIDSGTKSLPLPIGFAVDASSLKTIDTSIDINRDQNGCFYLEATGSGSFSIDFLPEQIPFISRPIHDDLSPLYRGQLSNKTEDLINNLSGIPTEKAEQAKKYILENHFYPDGDLQAALELQYKLRTESTGDNYLQNIDKSEYLECYSANTKFIAMMRKVGIPSRLVIGHRITNMKDGKALITESTGHAWSEIWDGKNWVQFDATPDKKSEKEEKDSKEKKDGEKDKQNEEKKEPKKEEEPKPDSEGEGKDKKEEKEKPQDWRDIFGEDIPPPPPKTARALEEERLAPLINDLTDRLRKVFMERANPEWEPAPIGPKLNMARALRMEVTGVHDSRIFERRVEPKKRNPVFIFQIDMSRSMRWHVDEHRGIIWNKESPKIYETRNALFVLSRVFKNLDIPFGVYGYNSADRSLGDILSMGLNTRGNNRGGSVDENRYFVFKDVNEPFDPDSEKLNDWKVIISTIEQQQGGTNPGYALQRSYEIVSKRPEEDKWILDLSDGEQNDYLEGTDMDIRKVVPNIEATARKDGNKLSMLCVGIGPDTEHVAKSGYKDFQIGSNVESFVRDLGDKLEEIIKR